MRPLRREQYSHSPPKCHCKNTVAGDFRLNSRSNSSTVPARGDFDFMGGYRKGPGIFPAIGVFFVAVCLTAAGETNSLTAEKALPAEGSAEWAQHVVQSYQQIQEQQRSMLVGIEQARQDAAAAPPAG